MFRTQRFFPQPLAFCLSLLDFVLVSTERIVAKRRNLRSISKPLRRRAVNEVDDVAYVLFVGQARETFFREGNDRTQVVGELPEQFESRARFEIAPADNGFKR